MENMWCQVKASSFWIIDEIDKSLDYLHLDFVQRTGSWTTQSTQHRSCPILEDDEKFGGCEEFLPLYSFIY